MGIEMVVWFPWFPCMWVGEMEEHWIKHMEDAWGGHAKPCTRDFQFMRDDKGEIEGVIWKRGRLQLGAISNSNHA